MTLAQPQLSSFFQKVESAIATLEHLAVEAAHSGQPCAQILFRAAELLRVTTLPEATPVTLTMPTPLNTNVQVKLS